MHLHSLKSVQPNVFICVSYSEPGKDFIIYNDGKFKASCLCGVFTMPENQSPTQRCLYGSVTMSITPNLCSCAGVATTHLLTPPPPPVLLIRPVLMDMCTTT